ncbi:acyl-CoA dehydrogenase/oxidase [Chytriomyces sp. MP71]|nr:acyl-CoA dehydrogenase/oxidase [Chytriomyces sp. MP71]
MSKTFTREEVARHNKPDDLWIVIDGKVYDLTVFADGHPGSAVVLWKVAGQDATEQFFGLHRQEVLAKYKRLIIGSVEGETSHLQPPPFGTISQVPYAESASALHRPTPFYNKSHLEFKKAVRAFCDEFIAPDVEFYSNSGKFPEPELFLKMGELNLHAARLGPGPHMKGMVFPTGLKAENFDYFHEQVVHEEFSRLGLYTYAEGIGSGTLIGLPPVMNFGPAWMQQKVVPAVLKGEKKVCLAITEPTAGSDVAGVQCEAVKTPDGKFFIVNGVKKWITNGTFCDYFTTAVKGEKGISVLLIEKSEGVSAENIKTSGTTSAGTSYVTFENVKVPVENLIGKEGQGFAVIMANFNHERWMMCVGACAGARQVVEECFKWASQRKVFGKALIEQPVIRFKLGEMIAELEAAQSWVDITTYQMTKMNYKEQSKHLAGQIALLKYKCTRMTHIVRDNSVQIFGGRAITRTGMGRVIENFQRVQKFGAILGGSEEIMADLGVRQAMKFFPKTARL